MVSCPKQKRATEAGLSPRTLVSLRILEQSHADRGFRRHVNLDDDLQCSDTNSFPDLLA